MPKLSLALIVCTLLLASRPALTIEPEFEQLPFILKAADVLPKEILADERYTIANDVINNGVFSQYQIESPYGKTTVHNTEQLLMRIDEITACYTMDKVKKSTIYAAALAKSAASPLLLAKGMVTHPIDTVANIGSGIGHFFGDIGYAMTSDDPHQESVAKTVVGLGQAKREFAFRLGVNPYGRYPPFQERLNDFGWVSVGGGLTVSAATMAAGSAASRVVSRSQTADAMRLLVQRLPPEQLQTVNTKKLKAMGLQKALIKVFLANYNYDPQEATRLVGALDAMKDVDGRSAFVARRAALAASQAEAIMLREWAEMMESYNRANENVNAMVMANGIVFLRKADGSATATLPTDYISWHTGMAVRSKQIYEGLAKQGIEGGELWFKGPVTANAVAGLEKQGWKVKAAVGKLAAPDNNKSK